MAEQAYKRVNISSGTPWEERVGFSRAVRIGNLVYTSGTTAMKEGALVGINDPVAQTVQILANIKWALEEAGASLDDVVRYRVYLVDIHDWTEVAQACKRVFGAIRPCNTLLAVSALIDPAMRVEIEVDAVVPPA